MNYFRLFAAGVLCVATATSCTKEPADDFAVPAAAPATADANDHRVPVDAALEGLRSLLDQIDATTRSAASRTIREVLPLRSRRVLTRTLESATDRPDTLLYLVNFSDETGYAVLGADDRMAPILALADDGSVSPDDFTADSIGLDKKLILNYASQLSDSLVYDSGDPWEIDSTDIVPGMEIKHFPEDSVEVGGRKWKVDLYLRPLLTTKWHQKPPFNNMIISNEGNYYAGCWMIALGQTLAYLEYPKHDSLDWAAMKQVWNYQNYDKKDEREASDLNNLMVADLIYNLYKRCKAHPTSTADNSGFRSTAASILNVGNAMVELGFENVSEVDYDADLVWRRMILYPSAPSLIRANNTNAPLSSGHAWVIDGFMQLEYTPVALQPLSLPHARVKNCSIAIGDMVEHPTGII